MNVHESFSDSIYEEQTHLADCELSSFVADVTKLYGMEQGRLSEEDWLDESELMDSPPRSEARNWCAVTIAASARLADRANVVAASLRAGPPVKPFWCDVWVVERVNHCKTGRKTGFWLEEGAAPDIVSEMLVSISH